MRIAKLTALRPPSSAYEEFNPNQPGWKSHTGLLPEITSEIAVIEGQKSVVKRMPPNYSPKALLLSNDVGVTLFEGTHPPLKVDEAIVRPRKKGPHTRRQFEEWKKEGKIVITDASLGEIRTRDIPILKYQRFDRHWFQNMSASAPRYRGRFVPLWNPMQGRFNTTLPGPTWGGPTSYDLRTVDPAIMHSHAIALQYSWFTGEPSTALSDYRSAVAGAQASILAAYMQIRPPPGLITEKVAELNESVFDVATELAEAPETIGMIYEALKKILLYTKEVRTKQNLIKRSKKPPESILDDLASLWMGYRYGIMPVIYSVNDAMNYLEKSGVLYRTVRGREDLELSVEVPLGTLKGDLMVQQRYFGKGKLSATTGNGLGFNPLTTLWEVTPLSFVVDWALNIGDLLMALTPTTRYDQVVHTFSTRLKSHVTLEIDDHAIPIDVDLYDRYNITPIDHVGLTFDPLLTLKRKLDAAALGWMLFLKDLRKK